jgi:hypothetical protein
MRPVVKEDLEMKRYEWAQGVRVSILAALETALFWAAWGGVSPGRVYAQWAPNCPPSPMYESWSPPCDASSACTGGIAPYAATTPTYGAYPPYGAVSGGPCWGAANTLPPGALACSPIVWGGGAGALVLFPDDANHEMFSYDSAIETNQVLDARDAASDLLPGVEARVTRFDTCAMAGWEALYWGLYPTDGTAYAYDSDVTGDLNSILNFDQLNYNGGPAGAYVDDAQVHRLRATTEFQNVELNRLWGVARACGGCSPWQLRALAGFRYLRYVDGLQLAADTTDTMFTGETDELYYTIDAENNLYGLQLGGTAERNRGGPWTALFGAKAGVYANDASATSHIGGAAGTATVNNGPNNGRAWLVEANKCDVAFVGEIRAGVARRASCHWRVLADYRVVAVSGVALPTNQIFHDLRGLQDVERLGTNGNVLLHGLFVGAERAY